MAYAPLVVWLWVAAAPAKSPGLSPHREYSVTDLVRYVTLCDARHTLPIQLITAIRAAKPCNDDPAHGRGLISPILGVGRMATLAIRRPWTSAILAVLDVLLIASAALLLVKPSTHTTTFLTQVEGLPPGAASCHAIYTQIKTPPRPV